MKNLSLRVPPPAADCRDAGRPRTCRLHFPSPTSTVREGPTSTGILDPAGAASVGINGTRGITFDNGPTDAHYGDLFVTGYLSHSVARFDWASQTYQPFVAPGSGGLDAVRRDRRRPGRQRLRQRSVLQNIIFRYDGATGAPLPAPGQTGAVFVNAGANGLK